MRGQQPEKTPQVRLNPIPQDKFAELHAMFLERMLRESDGVPFTSFKHRFFVDDEVRYKRRIYNRAEEALGLSRWRASQVGTGELLEKVRAACSPEVSNNLMEHKYGPEKSSYQALHRVRGPKQRGELEEHLFDLLRRGDGTPDDFGPRFDRLAEFLRSESLGERWDFLTYLAFLRDPSRYFSIRASRVQSLFDHLGYELKFAGRASWDRYELVLSLASQLRDRLAMYGTPEQVEIQSYLWVVSGLVSDVTRWRRERARNKMRPADIDFTEELARRQQRAINRERRGLQGEMYVAEQERARLTSARRKDLAGRVRCISAEPSAERTYDVLSFQSDGTELHIEVKATAQDECSDSGFWISEPERARGERDNQWCVYRVWNIDVHPNHRDLGNIVADTPQGWAFETSAWFVRCIEQ